MTAEPRLFPEAAGARLMGRERACPTCGRDWPHSFALHAPTVRGGGGEDAGGVGMSDAIEDAARFIEACAGAQEEDADRQWMQEKADRLRSTDEPLRVMGAVAHAVTRDHEDNDDCIVCVAARPVLAELGERAA